MPSASLASMQPARTYRSVFKSARLRVLASRLAKARANPRFSGAKRTLSMGSSPTPAKVETVIVSRDDALGLKAHTSPDTQFSPPHNSTPLGDALLERASWAKREMESGKKSGSKEPLNSDSSSDDAHTHTLTLKLSSMLA